MTRRKPRDPVFHDDRTTGEWCAEMPGGYVACGFKTEQAARSAWHKRNVAALNDQLFEDQSRANDTEKALRQAQRARALHDGTDQGEA